MPRAARGSTKRSRGSRRRTSARSTAFARISCANAPWRQEWIPCSRSSPNRRRRGSSTRHSTGGCRSSWPTRAKVFVARSVVRAFGGEDGPIDRLRKAAWDLAQWRDFTTAWTRPPFERQRQIEQALAEVHECAALTRHPTSTNDPLHVGTEPIRRLSDEITLQQSSGEDEHDYDGWEAALVDLSRDRILANAKTGRGASYANGVARDRVLQARVALKARLDQFRMDADADLAALLQRDLRGAIDRYDELKARAGALDFLDLLLGARDLVRDNAVVRQGFQARFKRIFVDEFQDTDPLQAEILLLLAADDNAETDWRRARPRPGTLFLVGDPKQSIYRFRRADVGVYREVCDRLATLGATLVHLNTSFRAVPEIQACVNNAFEPVMTGDAFTLQAPYVALAPHRSPLPSQPAIVALPVPEPYKWRYCQRGGDRALACPAPSAPSSSGCCARAAGW